MSTPRRLTLHGVEIFLLKIRISSRKRKVHETVCSYGAQVDTLKHKNCQQLSCATLSKGLA